MSNDHVFLIFSPINNAPIYAKRIIKSSPNKPLVSIFMSIVNTSSKGRYCLIKVSPSKSDMLGVKINSNKIKVAFYLSQNIETVVSKNQ